MVVLVVEVLGANDEERRGSFVALQQLWNE